MKCDDVRELLVDYLYGEMDKGEVKKFEGHIKRCTSCKTELASLQATSKLLQQWPDIDPKMQLVFVKEKRALSDSLRSVVPWRAPRLPKLAFGLATALASLLLLLALTNTTISLKNGNFELSASLFGRPKSAPTAPVITEADLIELQRANLLLCERLVRESEDRQKREIALALTELVRSADYQRTLDMQLFGRGLEEIQERAIRRIARTDQIVDGIVQYISQEGISKR